MNQKRKKLLIAAIAGSLIAGGATWFYLSNSGYESTDNAQVDGNIESIRSGITAYLESIRFTDNQSVKAGDTLLIFNTTALQARVKQAEAVLENAKANLSVSDIKALASREDATASVQNSRGNEQSIVIAKANIEKAQLDFDRTAALLKIKGATQEQYESVQNKLQIARADYEQAISRQQSVMATSLGLQSTAKAANHQISAAQALVKQREAELALTLDDLHHAYILAPFDGIVTKRTVQSGQYISTGQTLCAVIDTKHIWITANFKETQLNSIRSGQAVEIKIDAIPGLTVKGKVESFTGATGSKFSLLPPDNATGNFIKITQRFPIRISMDLFGPENKPTVLYPGLSAFVKVKTI
jgi:membrane fusion protein (multidrug efflux system)